MSESRGGGASEQLGGGGADEYAKHAQVGGSGGHAPPGKFLNLQALRLNLEHLEASETNYSHQ